MNDMLRRIVDVAGEGVLGRSVLAIREGGGVFEKVLGSGQYPRVLEIGTFRGISAAYMSQFCERVTTIDLVNGRLQELGMKFDRRQFWDSLGITNIDLHLVSNDAEKAQVVKRTSFDLAFIDGGKFDVAQDFQLVKHCGAVLFHDYSDRGKPELNKVYDFVNSLPKEQIEAMDIFALWRNG